jgi:hypothetical protein
VRFNSKFIEIKGLPSGVKLREYECCPESEFICIGSLHRVGIYNEWFILGLF